MRSTIDSRWNATLLLAILWMSQLPLHAGSGVSASANVNATSAFESSPTAPVTLEREYRDAGGFATIRAEARYGALSNAAASEASSTNNDFGYNGDCTATWGDEISIDAPGRDGTKGFVTFSVQLTGAVSAQSSNDQRIAKGGVSYSFSSGVGPTLVSKGQFYAVYGHGLIKAKFSG